MTKLEVFEKTADGSQFCTFKATGTENIAEEKAFGYTDDGYDGYEKIKGFTIKGKKGSTAHKYAKKNGFKFVAI